MSLLTWNWRRLQVYNERVYMSVNEFPCQDQAAKLARVKDNMIMAYGLRPEEIDPWVQFMGEASWSQPLDMQIVSHTFHVKALF